ncbi:MAG: hypothetical protein AABW81_02405 [Nanoarchaeota archaeon]
MTGFVCKRCKYRVESETDKSGKKCPYCNEGKMIEEPNAEELLEME